MVGTARHCGPMLNTPFRDWKQSGRARIDMVLSVRLSRLKDDKSVPCAVAYGYEQFCVMTDHTHPLPLMVLMLCHLIGRTYPYLP